MKVFSKNLAPILPPMLFVIFLLALFNIYPNGSQFSARVLSLNLGNYIFYKYYLFMLIAPIITLFLNIRFYKLFLTLYSIAFFIILSLQSTEIFYFILLYSAMALVLIFSICFNWPQKKLTFFISYFVLTLGTAYYYLQIKNSDLIGRILISFVAYDALIAWTWLYSQTETEKQTWPNNFYDLFLYLFLPFFFIRRLAISFSEFKTALNATSKSVESIYIGWTTVFRSTFFYLLLVLIAPYLRQRISYDSFYLLSSFITAYHYCGLTAGLILTLGLKIREPFDFFIFSTHPIDFWRRWNIYIRDWFSYFYFFPSLKIFKNIELSFLYTFFFSGVYHIFRFIIIDSVDGRLDFLFKFWIPGIILTIFSFFYLRLRSFFNNLNSGIRYALLLVGILIFWISYYYIRVLVIFVSNYFSNLLYR